jgi:tmRNA-binding protein
MSIDSELKMIKELFDIEFGLTVKGNEIKGYNNGKIYLDSINCIELAEAFLKISNFLESSNPNYDPVAGRKIDMERLFPDLK